MTGNVPAFISEHPRKFGGAVAAVSFGLVFFSFLLPLIEAGQGAESITISVKATVAGIVFFMVGMAFVLWGQKAIALSHPDPQNIQKTTVVFYIVVVAVAFAAYIFLEQFLLNSGYSRS